MKDKRSSPISIRLVGRRHHWNWHWRFTPRQWQILVGVFAGVVPLLLAAGVYGVLGRVVPASGLIASHRPGFLRSEVAALTRNTAAGIAAMGFELGALNADAAHLARVKQRLVTSTGVALNASRRGAPATPMMPVASRNSSHLIAKLRALADRLSHGVVASSRRAL